MTFRSLSIKRKLMLITMLTSSLALLLASLGFLVYDLMAARARMSHDLTTQAQIIGRNSMAALAFHDQRAVGEILSALRANDETVGAAVYTQDGDLFASYRRDGSAASVIPPHPEASGYRFTGDRLEVFHPMVLHGQTLGHSLHWFGHAAVARSSEPLHRHRRCPDGRFGIRRLPPVLAAPDGNLGTDSRSRADDEDGVDAEELCPESHEVSGR